MNDQDKTKDQLIEELRLHQTELEMQNEDLKRAHKALEESRDRFIALYDFAPVGYVTINAAGMIVEANLRACHLFNVARSQLIDSPFSRFVFTEDQDIFYLHRQTCLDQLTQQACELRMVKGDGAPFHVQMESRAVVDDSERQGHLRIALIDITERKKSEEALRETAWNLAEAQRVGRIGSWMLDSVTEEVTWSDELYRIFGIEKHDFRNTYQSFINRVHPDDRELVLETNARARDKGTAFDFEYRIVLPDGQLKTVREIGYAHLDKKGNVTGLFGVAQDITERKNLETQLLQSQKMEALGTLAAGVAHDFNNMLQVILGYADLLVSDKRPGDSGYNELHQIIKTSQDAADLVQKIRILSRRADIQRVPLEVNNNLREMVELLKHTLPRTVNIRTQLSENLDMVNADPGLMNQMVMNLAVNAGEAMPDGGTLRIETVNTELDDNFCRVHEGMKPGPHVMISVSDTGRGMSKDMIERMFDPFFSTKERDYHKGTGIGLSVVHGTVTLHGGCITVESEVGKGTTFRIYLPSLTPQKGTEAAEEAPDIPSGHETVLLVEDEETVRQLETTLLEMNGYRVLAVADGQEALEAYELEQANISLVILDIIMPRMEGKRCMEELLRINPSVKVLVTTGVAREDQIDEVVALGAKGSLMKPYSTRELLQRVRNILDSD